MNNLIGLGQLIVVLGGIVLFVFVFGRVIAEIIIALEKWLD